MAKVSPQSRHTGISRDSFVQSLYDLWFLWCWGSSLGQISCELDEDALMRELTWKGLKRGRDRCRDGEVGVGGI